MIFCRGNLDFCLGGHRTNSQGLNLYIPVTNLKGLVTRSSSDMLAVVCGGGRGGGGVWELVLRRKLNGLWDWTRCGC